jgi:16S rRNA processing protein RimM
MKVRTIDGLDLGTVRQIIPTGANDVICVEGSRGEVLLPMTEEVVVDVDTDGGMMVVDPLEGLIPDA